MWRSRAIGWPRRARWRRSWGEKRNARPGTVKGRDFSELLSRPRADRMVLRNGRPIALRLPDYSELDDLVGKDRG